MNLCTLIGGEWGDSMGPMFFISTWSLGLQSNVL